MQQGLQSDYLVPGPAQGPSVDSVVHTSTMRHVSSELQWIIVRLSPIFKVDDISIYTGVSIRSIYRIVQHFKIHHDIPNPIPRPQMKPRYHLRDLDVEVCFNNFNFAEL
jgi:hypothetical protein